MQPIAEGIDAGHYQRPDRRDIERSFDVTFLSNVGKLEVRLDDKVLKVIQAADIGARTRVRIPIDFRSLYKGGAQPDNVALQFALDGKPGFTAQIDNVVIPGLLAEEIEAEGLTGWTIDGSKGTAAVVDTTRFPVDIDVQPGKLPNVVKLGDAVPALLARPPQSMLSTCSVLTILA